MSSHHNMRTFYTLVLTQTLSLIGSRISGLAIGIHIFTETGSATPLALVAFFGIVPLILAASVSGVLADRWDRRAVMILSDAGQALGTVLLLISFAGGGFELWHLYLVTFIQAIFGVFQGPAFSASVTMLVPEAQRERANAIQQMTGPTAGIVAPALAGVIYALGGVVGAILVDLATFAAAMLVILLIHIPMPARTAEGEAVGGSAWREALGGLRYLWSRQTMFWYLLYISLINFLIGGTAVLLTPYILARTNNNEALLGLLLSVMNIGAIAGAVIIGVWGGTRPRIHTIMPALIVGGIMLMLVGMAQQALMIGLTLFLFLAMPSLINPLFISILQVKVPPDLQGRVFAAVGQFSMLLTPLSYLMVGPLVDGLLEPAVGTPGWALVAPLVGNAPGAGIGLLMMICGALTTLSTALIYALPAVRHMEANLPDYAAEPAPDALAAGLAGAEPSL